VSAVRGIVGVLGAPFRLGLVLLIRTYRVALSGYFGGQCRFYPSCSHYAEEAVRSHGAMRGSLLAAWRILRCGPFTAGGVDHVPPPRGGPVPPYDGVIHRRTAARES